MTPRTPPPLVCYALTGAALALLARWLAPAAAELPPGGDGAPQLFAFWPAVALVATWIWNGIEVAARVTLAAVQWSVTALWAFAKTVYNFAVDIGGFFVKVGREVWDVVRATYENVLKPAWQNFWKLYDRLRKWLDEIFGPVLRVLRLIRSRFLAIYSKFIRPILDLIGIGRRVLSVFQSFGWEWARKLDAQLAALQSRIDAPFRLVLAKINEVINLVNRVVTADGLFQRLALIRSIERDLRQVNRALVNWRSVPLTPADFQRARQRAEERTVRDVEQDIRAHLTTETGTHSALVNELAQSIARRIAA